MSDTDMTMWPHRNKEDHSELEGRHDQATDTLFEFAADLQDDAYRLGYKRGQLDAVELLERASKIIDYFANNRTGFEGADTPLECLRDVNALICTVTGKEVAHVE